MRELIEHLDQVARSADTPDRVRRLAAEWADPAAREGSGPLGPRAPVPQLWGPPADVPDDAPLLDRIVAITGRRP